MQLQYLLRSNLIYFISHLFEDGGSVLFIVCIFIMLNRFCFLYRQEAAGALWNLSFDDRNREAIAATGGVEALVWTAILENLCDIYKLHLW